MTKISIMDTLRERNIYLAQRFVPTTWAMGTAGCLLCVAQISASIVLEA